MNPLTIGNTHIIISHISHFVFSHPKKSRASAYEAAGEKDDPARLAIHVVGDVINVSGKEAEQAYHNLIALLV
jgi:L-arabinose isomerase